MAGTRGYMAPEVRDGGRPSVKSEVFSIGVTLLELWCGDLWDPHYPAKRCLEIATTRLTGWCVCARVVVDVVVVSHTRWVGGWVGWVDG